ncbi:orotate phosphoribosyltransferase [Candidatus Gottesmanbacteria bacterium]|nr:orotate phosphoribosyltransferase [Candidatus Gottesmanbacteria bacterium]
MLNNAVLVDPVLDLLKKVKAVYIDDHFVLTSGKHGSVYVNKDAMYQHPQETTLVCRMFAERFQDTDIDVVVGPAVGGIVLAQWTAYHLTQLKGKEVLGVYTEKDADKNQVFTRGYDVLVKNKKILVVEDIATTGGSVIKVIDSVRRAGGKVVAVVVMVNRNPDMVTSETIGAPFSALCVLKAEAFDEKDCPMCKEGLPINTTVGHGKKYLEAHKK